MKFHEIDVIGRFWMSAIPTLTVWTIEDKHRLVYVEDEDNVYYGGTTEWIEMGKIFIDVGADTDPVDGGSFAGRKYHAQMVNGNLRFTY